MLTALEKRLNSPDGVTNYDAAASVIPVFLIALKAGDSPTFTARHRLRTHSAHALRLVIVVLAIAQAAAIAAMPSGGG